MDEQLQNTIEDYLLGKLSKTESSRLETQMAEDPALFQEVQAHRLTLIGLDRLAAADLRQKFDKWETEIDDGGAPQPAINPWFNWRLLSFALALLLVAGIFWYWVNIRPELDRQNTQKEELARREADVKALEMDIRQEQEKLTALLAQQNDKTDTALQAEIKRLRAALDEKDKALFEQKKETTPKNKPMALAAPLPPSFAARGGEGIIRQAAGAFDSKRYAEAEALLKSIGPEASGQQKDVQQMLPYAIFYQGKYGEAALLFTQWKTADRFAPKSVDWYIAYCYAKDGRNAHAKQALQIILDDPQHPNYEEAKRLRAQLK